MERNPMSGPMMLAMLQPGVVTVYKAMTADEVVIKHRDRASVQLARREQLELYLDPGSVSKFMGKVFDAVMIKFVVQKVCS